MLVVLVVLFLRLPSAFLPAEDQGTLIAMVQTPAGATQERTMHSIEKLEQHFLDDEPDAVDSMISVQGFSFGGSGQNSGIAFIKLKNWDERKSAELHAGAVAGRAMGALSQIKDAMAFAFPPPPIPELGIAAGFDFLPAGQRRPWPRCAHRRPQRIPRHGRQNPLLANVRPNGQDDTPQFHIDIDTKRAPALGLPIDSINSTLSTAWGGSTSTTSSIAVASSASTCRPMRHSACPRRISSSGRCATRPARWCLSRRSRRRTGVSARRASSDTTACSAVEIQGEAAAGVSTGDAMAEVERLVAKLPRGLGVEWTALSYQERQAGAQTPLLYSLSLLIVFLCLAALYESWTIPTAVLLVAPLGILGAMLANSLRGMERDVYFQVAMLTTRRPHQQERHPDHCVRQRESCQGHGFDRGDDAGRARSPASDPDDLAGLRIGRAAVGARHGRGLGAQRAIGTGVLGGMIVGTLLGIFFVPLFFVVVERLLVRKKPATHAVGLETKDDGSGVPSHG